MGDNHIGSIYGNGLSFDRRQGRCIAWWRVASQGQMEQSRTSLSQPWSFLESPWCISSLSGKNLSINQNKSFYQRNQTLGINSGMLCIWRTNPYKGSILHIVPKCNPDNLLILLYIRSQTNPTCSQSSYFRISLIVFLLWWESDNPNQKSARPYQRLAQAVSRCNGGSHRLRLIVSEPVRGRPSS